MENQRQKQLDQVAKLLSLDLSDEVRLAIERAGFKIALTMADILEQVPGESVSARCRNLGIARWTYYRWKDRAARPKRTQATRLSELTGYSVEEILGFDGTLPRRKAKKAKARLSSSPAPAASA